LVGFDLYARFVDHFSDFIFKSGVNAQRWQAQGHDLSHGRHSLRLGLDKSESKQVFDKLHARFIEGK
jgi:hypothetical protein